MFTSVSLSAMPKPVYFYEKNGIRIFGLLYGQILSFLNAVWYNQASFNPGH